MKRNENSGDSKCQHQGELVSSQRMKPPANETREEKNHLIATSVWEKWISHLPLFRLHQKELHAMETERNKVSTSYKSCVSVDAALRTAAHHRFRCPRRPTIDRYLSWRRSFHLFSRFFLARWCYGGALSVREINSSHAIDDEQKSEGCNGIAEHLPNGMPQRANSSETNGELRSKAVEQRHSCGRDAAWYKVINKFDSRSFPRKS